MKTNPEIFTEAAPIILDALYDQFPLAVQLDFSKLMEVHFDFEALNAAMRESSFEANKRWLFTSENVRKRLLCPSLEPDQREKLEALEQQLSTQEGQPTSPTQAEKIANELGEKQKLIHSIYQHTAHFLVLEGFCSQDENNCYRLSLAGFHALGLQLNDFQIERKKGAGPINLIKEGLQKGSTELLSEGFMTAARTMAIGISLSLQS